MRLALSKAGRYAPLWISLLIMTMWGCAQNELIEGGETISSPGRIYVRSIFFNGTVSKGFDVFPDRLSQIKINFNCAIDTNSVTVGTISVTEKATGANIPLTIEGYERGDSTIVFSLDPSRLIRGQLYTLRILNAIKSADEKRRPMEKDFSQEYLAPLASDFTFRVFYVKGVGDTMEINSRSGPYDLALPTDGDIARVPLYFTLGENTSLYVFGDTTKLNKRGAIFFGEFDFSQAETKTFSLQSQAGNAQLFTIRISYTPPFQILSPAFRNGGKLPVKYASKLNPSDPNPVSPSLIWRYNPYFNTGSYILLCWNEDRTTGYIDWILNVDIVLYQINEGRSPGISIQPYTGFARPGSGGKYRIHYSIFSIAEDQSQVSSMGFTPAQLGPPLVEYAKKALAKDPNDPPTKRFSGITVNAFADTYGIFETP